MNELGNKIAKKRRDIGLTQIEFAENSTLPDRQSAAGKPEQSCLTLIRFLILLPYYQ